MSVIYSGETIKSATIDRDVLVIGGGPAGTWAAGPRGGRRQGRARRQGLLRHQRRHRAFGHRRLVRAARSGQARGGAWRAAETLGGHLADRGWMDRVLDQTYENVDQLAEWGYPFPHDDEGEPRGPACRGPSTCG